MAVSGWEFSKQCGVRSCDTIIGAYKYWAQKLTKVHGWLASVLSTLLLLPQAPFLLTNCKVIHFLKESWWKFLNNGNVLFYREKSPWMYPFSRVEIFILWPYIYLIEWLLYIKHCFKFLRGLGHLILTTLRENISINLHFAAKKT